MSFSFSAAFSLYLKRKSGKFSQYRLYSSTTRLATMTKRPNRV